MKKILVLLCFILYIISAHAQYCSIKKGRTAYYVTTEVKEGKTLKDTMCIADVVDKGDRLIIREDAFGEHYDSLSIKSGINRLFYIYHKRQDMTEVILLDGKSEYEYQKYSKNIYAEGRISIPLKDHVQNGDDIPQCNFLQKSGPMTMKASLKGNIKDVKPYILLREILIALKSTRNKKEKSCSFQKPNIQQIGMPKILGW